MFTGLVQAIGTVKAVQRHSSPHKGVRLVVDPGSWKYRKQARAGDSVSVAGCCLTLVRGPGRVRGKEGAFEFDVVAETLDKTMLGSLRSGSKVNLEHAVMPMTLMGGHIVQGHVDGVGTIDRVQQGEDWRIWVAIPSSAANLARYLVPKGSICIDGVSLTIASLWSNKKARGFSVALIPTTLEKTTLADLKPGDTVNLEMDLIAKTVVHWLTEFGSPIRKGPTKRRT